MERISSTGQEIPWRQEKSIPKPILTLMPKRIWTKNIMFPGTSSEGTNRPLKPSDNWWGNLFLTLVLLIQDRHCIWKQCRSRSDGFWRSHLIRIYTVFRSVCEFRWTDNIKLSDWLTVRNGCGKPNLFSRIRVNFVTKPQYVCHALWF